MPIELPPGFLDPDRWTEFRELSEGALLHMIESGEVPEFVGAPMTSEDAVAYLNEFLVRNRATLVEGGVEFLGGLARRLVQGDEPDGPIGEFEAALLSLTDEQLAALNAEEADAVEALRADVVDRRRALLAEALDTGKQILRGAIASGLFAILGAS